MTRNLVLCSTGDANVYINPNISAAKKRFDEIADELSKLDPKCPAFRYYSKSSEGGARATLS